MNHCDMHIQTYRNLGPRVYGLKDIVARSLKSAAMGCTTPPPPPPLPTKFNIDDFHFCQTRITTHLSDKTLVGA